MVHSVYQNRLLWAAGVDIVQTITTTLTHRSRRLADTKIPVCRCLNIQMQPGRISRSIRVMTVCAVDIKICTCPFIKRCGTGFQPAYAARYFTVHSD